jgi:RNA polymerase sigma factor (sigma-70 family)
MPTSPMNEVIQYLRSAGLLPDGVDLTDGQLLECFVTRREPAALEALVWRHGPMVWGVCHRILGKYHDAEDAFQATFLVLIRKAASIYPRAKVGNWLYGVAHQTALKARATRAKRQVREKPVTEMDEPAVPEGDQWSDLQPLLDQEVSRLPEKYHTVIVLCALGGITGKEAARHLDLPEGTVASRLARARTMLAKRLARLGLLVSGGALAEVLSQRAVSAAAPLTLMSSTIKAMTAVVAGQAEASGVISGTVATLAKGVMKTMLLNKILKVAAVLLVLAMIGFGAELYTHLMAGVQQDPADKPTFASEKGQRDKKEGKGAQDDEAGPVKASEEQGVEKEIAAFLKAHAVLAQKAYDAASKLLLETQRFGDQLILLGKPEEVYIWSVRWLQAEREVNPKGAEQVAALEAHLKRMTDLEKKVNNMIGPGLLPKGAQVDAEWYRVEAQLWVAQAKLKVQEK